MSGLVCSSLRFERRLHAGPSQVVGKFLTALTYTLANAQQRQEQLA